MDSSTQNLKHVFFCTVTFVTFHLNSSKSGRQQGYSSVIKPAGLCKNSEPLKT